MLKERGLGLLQAGYYDRSTTDRRGYPLLPASVLSDETIIRARRNGWRIGAGVPVPRRGYESSRTQTRQDGNPYMINDEAYDNTRMRLKPFFDDLAWVREGYFGSSSVPGMVTVQQAREIVQIAFVVVPFLLNRGEKPFAPQDELPVEAGDMNRNLAGFVSSLRNLLVYGGHKSTDIAPGAEEFYDFIDGKKGVPSQLVTLSGEACAAQKDVIIATYKQITQGHHGNPLNSNLRDIVGNFDDLKKFALAQLEFTDMIDRAKSTAKLLLRASAALPTQEKKHEAALNTVGLLQGHFLQIQHDMNEALGRDPDDAPDVNIEAIANIVLSALN